MTLEIIRPWAYFGCVRKLKVFVNGDKVSEVSTKESEIIDLPEGTHSVQVGMDWCKSKPYAVSSEKNTTLTVSCANFVLATLFCFTKPSKVFSLNAIQKT